MRVEGFFIIIDECPSTFFISHLPLFRSGLENQIDRFSSDGVKKITNEYRERRSKEAAHEIGHQFELQHENPIEDGKVMGRSAIGEREFLEKNIKKLRRRVKSPGIESD